MGKVKNILSWVGIVILGLAHGVLEDLMFLNVLVEYMPPSWDLTGDLFFTFTVPLAQLLVLAITGTIGWFLLGLNQLPRLITFWALWSVSRATFLTLINNPPLDVLLYLLWIALWCALLGLLAHFTANRQQTAGGSVA